MPSFDGTLALSWQAWASKISTEMAKKKHIITYSCKRNWYLLYRSSSLGISNPRDKYFQQLGTEIGFLSWTNHIVWERTHIFRLRTEAWKWGGMLIERFWRLISDHGSQGMVCAFLLNGRIAPLFNMCLSDFLLRVDWWWVPQFATWRTWFARQVAWATANPPTYLYEHTVCIQLNLSIVLASSALVTINRASQGRTSVTSYARQIYSKLDKRAGHKTISMPWKIPIVSNPKKTLWSCVVWFH